MRWMMCQHSPWYSRTRRSNAPGRLASTASTRSRSGQLQMSSMGQGIRAVGKRLQRACCNRSGNACIHGHEGQPFPPICQESPMDFAVLIPISLFVCIAYAIKVVMDARVRHQLVNAGGSADLVDSVLRDEELRRRHSSLRWGIVLLSLAVGFGLIQWFGWQEVTPGMIAVLAGATGLGNLAFFAISRKLG